MLGSIFIFKKNPLFSFFGLLSVLLLFSSTSWAAEPGGKVDRTLQPQEDDYLGTPATDYANFNDEEEEDEETRFLQFGRLFGMSLGLGYSGISGNRALLWRGGFPAIDIKLHYWFNFNFGLDLQLTSATHDFNNASRGRGHVDVGLVHMGIDLKYYFDTRNLSAPISFANPFLLGGFGSYTKTESSANLGTSDSETSFGVALGGGVEFTIKPKKVFFTLEARVHLLTFSDTNSDDYTGSKIPDLTGMFYSLSSNILFTW